MQAAALRPHVKYLLLVAVLIVLAVLVVAATLAGAPAPHSLASTGIDGWLDGR
jgi:hypothetical protein